MAMSERERRTLWVKAGGRCTLCKVYLLEGGLTHAEVSLGEGAHIVGQLKSAGSPRGLSGLVEAERDKAGNIMLACSNCHTEIDKAKVAQILTVEELLRRKTAHEDEVRHQTGLTTDRRTAVLRVHGSVRGAAMAVDVDAAAVAVIQSSDRFPLFPESYDRQGLEIDLRHLAGETGPTRGYYDAATAMVDAVVRGRLHDGVKRNEIAHLSVFAIARLPLLVYLGWTLDDGIATDVYQRHRATGSWMWPVDGATTSFVITPALESVGDEQEVVLITNLSGTTPRGSLPAELRAAPAFTLQAVASSAHEDVIASPDSLAFLRDCLRRFFSDLESTHKQLQRLHVFGGLPASAGVSLGQCLKARNLRPAIVLYDLTDSGYQKALEI